MKPCENCQKLQRKINLLRQALVAVVGESDPAKLRNMIASMALAARRGTDLSVPIDAARALIETVEDR